MNFAKNCKTFEVLIFYAQETHLRMATSDSDSEGNLVVDDGNGIDQGNLLKSIDNKMETIHSKHFFIKKIFKLK